MNKEKIFILGGGSNTLITDNLFDGVVIKLSKNFNNISLLSGDIIIAGSAVSDKSLSEFAMDNNLGGFEFLSCIPGTVGGGIKTVEDIRDTLLAGADKVSINTAGLYNPKFIEQSSRRFGNQCIVVAIDTMKTGENFWTVFSHGGTKNTKKNALEWAIEAETLGAGELLITSMNRDGTKSWFDNEFLKNVSAKVNIPIIASGGAGKPEHFKDAFLIGRSSAVLAASVFHYGEIKIQDLKKYLVANDIPMRL